MKAGFSDRTVPKRTSRNPSLEPFGSRIKENIETFPEKKRGAWLIPPVSGFSDHACRSPKETHNRGKAIRRKNQPEKPQSQGLWPSMERTPRRTGGHPALLARILCAPTGDTLRRIAPPRRLESVRPPHPLYSISAHLSAISQSFGSGLPGACMPSGPPCRSGHRSEKARPPFLPGSHGLFTFKG